MATSEDAVFVASMLRPLCGPLYDSVQQAVDLADLHFIEYDMVDTDFRRERTDLTRAHIRRLLRTADLGEWCLGRGGNGQVPLACHLMTAKVLHVGPDASVPAPGPSRVDYYQNQDVGLFGVAASRLLLLWMIEPKTEQAVIRVVRPIGSWKYPQSHLADIDFVLTRVGADLDDLEFTPQDDGLELPFDIEDDDEEEGDVGTSGR